MVHSRALNPCEFSFMTAALSRSQVKYLKGIAHHLQPVVTVAAKGLSENVMMELEQTLERHELIKVKLRQDRDERALTVTEIEARCGASLVMSIGQTATFFRRNEKDPQLALPKG